MASGKDPMELVFQNVIHVLSKVEYSIESIAENNGIESEMENYKKSTKSEEGYNLEAIYGVIERINLISRNYEHIIQKVSFDSSSSFTHKLHSPEKSTERLKAYEKKISELEKENKKLKHKLEKYKKMSVSSSVSVSSLSSSSSAPNTTGTPSSSPCYVDIAPPPPETASSLLQALQEGKPSPATTNLNDLAAALGTSTNVTSTNQSDDVCSLMEALQGGKSASSPATTDINDLAAALGTPGNTTLASQSDDVCSLMEALQGSKDLLGGEKEADSLSVKSGGEGGADGEDKPELVVDDSLFKDSEAVRKDESAAVRLSKMIAKAENLMVVLNMKKFPFASRSGGDSAMASEAGNSGSSSSQKMSQRSAGSKKEKKLLKLLKN